MLPALLLVLLPAIARAAPASSSTSKTEAADSTVNTGSRGYPDFHELSMRYKIVTEALWNGMNQGLHMSWVPQYLARRHMSQAEKRHQNLLPYHPVVRFRGLGGPGEAWPENGAGGELAAMAAAFSPLLTGNGERASQSAIDLAEQFAGLEGDLNKEQLSAGELLTLLESMVGVHDDGTRAKSLRFGINRRR